QDIGNQAVLGIEESQYRTTPEQLAERLDRSYLSPRGPARRIVWPENMGGAFAGLVTVVLQRQDLPFADEYLSNLWKHSEPWRIECLSDAERLTGQKGGTGIRRAEIWNAAGRLLGVLGADREFDKPRDLVAIAASELPHLKDEVLHFVNVVNICYERSQAVKF